MFIWLYLQKYMLSGKLIFDINYQMEEKKAQIKEYLKNVVTPFLTPLMEEMARQRPKNLTQFAFNYLGQLRNDQKKIETHSDSEESEEEADRVEIDKQFQLRLEESKSKRKMSRQGISAEVYGQFNKKEEFIPKVIEKDPKTIQTITELVKKSILFKSITDDDISILVNAMSIQNHSVGDLIIQEKEKGEILYVVGQGQYECWKTINGTETRLKNYVKGDSFGQLALMYNAPRAASIKCSKEGVLYGLDRQTFKNIVEESANRRRKKFRSMLSNISILSEIDPYQKEQLCDILKEERFAAQQYVMKEGQQGDKFYMIVEGNLIAEKQGKKVFEFKEGEYFGEIALVRDMPRQASVKCMTDCRLVSIERDAFKRMFGPIEEILKRNEEKYRQYIAS